jgi:hypothetical protein
MKAYKLRLVSFGILAVSVIASIISGCKKNDKLAELPVQIKSYYPNSGLGGTLVTIEGENFASNILQYKAAVGGVAAEVISATKTAVVVRMPATGKTGALSLTVREQAFGVGQYTYQTLSISRIYPNNGTTGTQIRISGTGFSSIKEPATVFVNGQSALLVSASDTLIVAEIPVNVGSGPVVVKVDGMEAKGQYFRFQLVADIKPLTGGPNTRVKIKGSGFETSLAGNIVDFNGKNALVESAKDTEIVVLAPAGVTTGPLSVNINGQKITGPAFTVVGNPVITVVSPLSGPQGAVMTISGDVFSTERDENKVFINGVDVPVQTATKTKLTLTLPGGTGSGKVKVVVNDQATEGPVFKDQTLGISTLTPDNGLAGTTVTISGTGFSTVPSDNIVTFNGAPATVTAATATTLTLAAPPTVSTGEVKLVVSGVEALAPVLFKRAGVMTLAGGPASTAFSNTVYGIAIDSHENLYVTDQSGKTVKKIAPDGTLSTLQVNGVDVVFGNPTGIVIDKNDNIYIADQANKEIRKITPAGQNLLHTSGFSAMHLAIDDAGNIFANASGFAAGMYKVNAAGSYSKLGGPNWPLYGSATDAAGNIYYPDNNNNSSNAVIVTTTAGQTRSLVGYSDAGYADGTGSNARFYGIMSIALSKPGELLVADAYNSAIRKIDIATATASTLFKFTNGFSDGTLSSAKFNSYTDMAIGKDGSIYILDASNKAVRKIFLQ